MSRSYRYALICLLVGCIPPPADGYSLQTHSPSQYQQAGWQDGSSQQSGYGEDGESGNGESGNGDSGNGEWTCSAEASFGTAIGEGPMNYSVKTGYGTASTRDEAAVLALNDCGETVNLAILIADDMSQEIGTCGVARCTNIGR